MDGLEDVLSQHHRSPLLHHPPSTRRACSAFDAISRSPGPSRQRIHARAKTRPGRASRRSSRTNADADADARARAPTLLVTVIKMLATQ